MEEKEMAINLQDIRTSVQTYLNEKVIVKISELIPESGIQLGQNEKFAFKVTVSNAPSNEGGLALKNVRYYIEIDNPLVAKLYVPPNIEDFFHVIGWAKSEPNDNSENLQPGKLVNYYYLFPGKGNKHKDYLNPGESKSFGSTIFSESHIKGKTQTPLNGSGASIVFKVLAEIDLDYIFPKNEDSPIVTKPFSVVF